MRDPATVTRPRSLGMLLLQALAWANLVVLLALAMDAVLRGLLAMAAVG